MFYKCDAHTSCVNAANLEDKTKEIVTSVKKSYCSVLQIGCIPTDMQGIYTSLSDLTWASMFQITRRTQSINFSVDQNWRLTLEVHETEFCDFSSKK